MSDYEQESDYALFIRKPIHKKWMRYSSQGRASSHETMTTLAKRHLKQGIADTCSYLITYKREDFMWAIDQKKGERINWEPKLWGMRRRHQRGFGRLSDHEVTDVAGGQSAPTTLLDAGVELQ